MIDNYTQESSGVADENLFVDRPEAVDKKALDRPVVDKKEADNPGHFHRSGCYPGYTAGL